MATAKVTPLLVVEKMEWERENDAAILNECNGLVTSI
jgi:hypothetical protein